MILQTLTTVFDSQTGGLTSGLAAAGSAILQFSARLEQTKIGFATLLGSTAAAELHLKELQTFANSTPFEFEEVARASRRFQNMGVSAKEVIPLLTAVGDAVAAAGGGSDEINRVSLAISQISAKSKVSAEEINQLAEAGVGGWKILANQLGIATADVIKLSEQGKISSDVFLKAFKNFSELNYGGAMEKQSRTFLGAWSTITDTLLTTGAATFEGIFADLSRVMADTADQIKNDTTLVAALETIGEGIGDAVEEIGYRAGQSFAEALLGGVESEAGNAEATGITFGTFIATGIGAAIGGFFGGPAGVAIGAGLGGTLGASTADSFIEGFGDVIGRLGNQSFVSEREKAIGERAIASEFAARKEQTRLEEQHQKNLKITNELLAKGAELVRAGVAAEAEKKGASIIQGLVHEISAFGDETEVAATKQKLLLAGITNLASPLAENALRLAAFVDKLKQADKVFGVYTGLQEELRRLNDTTQEGETRQRLLATGIDLANDAMAQQTLALARLIDAKKREKEAIDASNKSWEKSYELTRAGFAAGRAFVDAVERQGRQAVGDGMNALAGSGPGRLGVGNNGNLPNGNLPLGVDFSAAASRRLELAQFEKEQTERYIQENLAAARAQANGLALTREQIRAANTLTAEQDKYLAATRAGVAIWQNVMDAFAQVTPFTNWTREAEDFATAGLSRMQQGIRSLVGFAGYGLSLIPDTSARAARERIVENLANLREVVGRAVQGVPSSITGSRTSSDRELRQTIESMLLPFREALGIERWNEVVAGFVAGLKSAFSSDLVDAAKNMRDHVAALNPEVALAALHFREMQQGVNLTLQMTPEMAKLAGRTREFAFETDVLAGKFKANTAAEIEFLRAATKRADVANIYTERARELTGQLAEQAAVTETARLEQDLLTEAYRRQEPEQIAHLRRLAAQVDAEKEAAEKTAQIRQLAQSLESEIVSTLERARQGGLRAVLQGWLDDFTRFIEQLIAKALAAKLAKALFGVLENQQQGGGGGGFWSGLLRSILGAVIGGSGSGSVTEGFPTNPAGGRPFASGGMASGLSLVGEEGPELVDFRTPTRVYTAAKTRALTGGSLQNNNQRTFNIYLPPESGRGYHRPRGMREAARELTQYLRFATA